MKKLDDAFVPYKWKRLKVKWRLLIERSNNSNKTFLWWIGRSVPMFVEIGSGFCT